MIHVQAVPILSDNYAWLLRDAATGAEICVAGVSARNIMSSVQLNCRIDAPLRLVLRSA